MASRHRKLRRLAAIHPLGVLDARDRWRHRLHRRRCAECRRLEASSREVSAALLAGLPEGVPTAPLRARVLETVLAAAGTRRVGTTRPLLLALTAAAAAAACVALWWTPPGAEPSGAVARIALVAAPDVPGAAASIAWADGHDEAVLQVAGLPPARGRSYQLWRIRDGAPESLLVFDVESDGSRTARIASDAMEGTTYAVSLEPRGGSPGPTGPIVLASH